MDYLSGIWQEIMARPDGPMAVRVVPLASGMDLVYQVIVLKGLRSDRGCW